MEKGSKRRQLLRALGAASVTSVVGPSLAELIGDPETVATAAVHDSASTTGHHAGTMLNSDWIATAETEDYGTLATNSDGDLWPSCWADNGQLYAANGDGKGFYGQGFADIVMNQVSGTPSTGLSGTALAAGDALGKVWANPDNYNRKPTGMAAVDGNDDGSDELYLAYQDLNTNFDDAPNASVSVSMDYGKTWEQTSSPMFTDHEFTTVFFLDYGQSYANETALAPKNRGHLYAYGLDYNWRTSNSDSVPDPTRLYLARVPYDTVMDRSAWEWFDGHDANGNPKWASSIGDKVAVLRDDRRIYKHQFVTDNPANGESVSVLSQGSVVYNAPLDRYIYSSWTECTWEFYEAPEPWGPWRLFFRQDFGSLPWFGKGSNCTGPKNGGYATTIPSKFISDDGTAMWVQSNWFVNVACGANTYDFNLRPFDIATWHRSTPHNARNANRNLAIETGTVSIEKSAHYGHDEYYNSGIKTQSEDSWDGTHKSRDFWGYIWDCEYSINTVEYTTGKIFDDGGWFASTEDGVEVEVRRNHDWLSVRDLSISPTYPYDDSAGPNNTYTLTFNDTHGDGVRIVGVPGGSSNFTSISELDVYFD